MTAAEIRPTDANIPSEADSEAQQVVSGESWSDEKEDVGSETEEKEEATSKKQTHVDREAFPATFDGLCRQMMERANFLLEVMRLFELVLVAGVWYHASHLDTATQPRGSRFSEYASLETSLSLNMCALFPSFPDSWRHQPSSLPVPRQKARRLSCTT